MILGYAESQVPKLIIREIIVKEFQRVRSHSWARTRGAQLSAGYTVNTCSKPPLYDASKGNDVWFSQRVGFYRATLCVARSL